MMLTEVSLHGLFPQLGNLEFPTTISEDLVQFQDTTILEYWKQYQT
jgi:hypothetical protein